MEITVAILADHAYENLPNCIKAIKNQRVLNADKIKIYDIDIPTDIENIIAQEKKCEILPLLKNSNLNQTFKFSQIIADNCNTDILILIDPNIEIARSCISEHFRLFLKHKNLAVVYGRQIASYDNTNLLTRFWFNYYYPLTKRDEPIWHILSIFSSYRLMAINIKQTRNIEIIPDVDYEQFGEIYMNAKLAEKGFRILYNPLAIGFTKEIITPQKFFTTFKNLYYFLMENPWLKSRWRIHKNETRLVIKSLYQYLHTYSSQPLEWLNGLICSIYLILGIFIAQRNYISKTDKTKKSDNEENSVKD